MTATPIQRGPAEVFVHAPSAILEHVVQLALALGQGLDQLPQLLITLTQVSHALDGFLRRNQRPGGGEARGDYPSPGSSPRSARFISSTMTSVGSMVTSERLRQV